MANQNIKVNIGTTFDGKGFQQLSGSISQSARQIKGVTKGIGDLSAGFASLGGAAGKVAGGIGDLAGGLASGGPVGLAIAGITVAVSGLTWAWNKYKEATDGVIEQAKKLYGNLDKVREATHKMYQERFAKKAAEEKKAMEERKRLEDEEVKRRHAILDANAALAKSQFDLIDGQEKLNQLAKEGEWEERLANAANDSARKIIQAQIDLEKAQMMGADKIRRAEQDYKVAVERSVESQGTLSDEEFQKKRTAAINNLKVVSQNRDIVKAEVKNEIQRATNNLEKVRSEVAKEISKNREEEDKKRVEAENKRKKEQAEKDKREVKEKAKSDVQVLDRRIDAIKKALEKQTSEIQKRKSGAAYDTSRGNTKAYHYDENGNFVDQAEFERAGRFAERIRRDEKEKIEGQNIARSRNKRMMEIERDIRRGKAVSDSDRKWASRRREFLNQKNVKNKEDELKQLENQKRKIMDNMQKRLESIDKNLAKSMTV